MTSNKKFKYIKYMPGITKKFCDNKIKSLEEQITIDNILEINEEISKWRSIKRKIIDIEIRRALREEEQLRREVEQLINNITNPLNLPN